MSIIISASIESQKKFSCKGPNPVLITINKNIQKSQSGIEVTGEFVFGTDNGTKTLDTTLRFCNLYRQSICEMCGEICPVTSANEFSKFIELRKKA